MKIELPGILYMYQSRHVDYSRSSEATESRQSVTSPSSGTSASDEREPRIIKQSMGDSRVNLNETDT